MTAATISETCVAEKKQVSSDSLKVAPFLRKWRANANLMNIRSMAEPLSPMHLKSNWTQTHKESKWDEEWPTLPWQKKKKNTLGMKRWQPAASYWIQQWVKNPMGFTHRDRNREGTRGNSPNSINHLAWIATKCDWILFRCMCVCVWERRWDSNLTVKQTSRCSSRIKWYLTHIGAAERKKRKSTALFSASKLVKVLVKSNHLHCRWHTI